MNKKIIIFFLIAIAIIALFVLLNISNNKELDRIQDYTITVTPLDDGSLNMLYDITWKVLDSESEGPMNWVQIGIPNSSVDSITGLTNNIKSIEQYNSTYIKIDFKQNYVAGDIINFRFKLHQNNMYSLENGKYIYKFTPGWFKKIAIDNITIKWKASNVLEANTETREGGYYIWNTQLKKNEKLSATIKYDEATYKAVSTSANDSYMSNFNMFSDNSKSQLKNFIILFIIAMVLIIIGSFSSDNYSRHRGYGCCNHYDDNDYHSSCVSSSSCACACACAGGGRAGCSKKDFYGTKLKSKDILEKL